MHYDTNDLLRRLPGEFTDADVLSSGTAYTAYIFSGTSIIKRIDFQTLSLPVATGDWQVDEGVPSAINGFTLGSFPFNASGTPSTGSPVQGRYEVHTQVGELLLLPHYTQQLITNGMIYTRKDDADNIACVINSSCFPTSGYAVKRSFTGTPANTYRTAILAIQPVKSIDLGSYKIHDDNLNDIREIFLLN